MIIPKVFLTCFGPMTVERSFYQADAGIRQAIEKYGIRFLDDRELDEEFVGIKAYFGAHDEEYARVRELLSLR